VPLVRILVLALALTHVVGLADLVMDDACAEACTDDGCGKDCLPGLACRCHCPSAMPAVGELHQAVVDVAAPREMNAFPEDQRMHGSPDPREILHVPRRVG
jgi:hypothetical protein